MNNYQFSSIGSSTSTVQVETERPRVLVLRLRSQKKEIAEQKNALEQKVNFLTSTYNFGAYLFNLAYGSTRAPIWKSTRSGELQCQLGGIGFKLQFDKLNPNHEEYGALPLQEQQQLAAQLTSALEAGNIAPGAVMRLLNQLSSVQVDLESIIMITPHSRAFEALKRKCEKLLQKDE